MEIVTFLVMGVMLATIMLFFSNINNETVSWISFVISLVCSSAIVGFIVQKYSSKFPFKLTMDDKTLTIYKLIGKKDIPLQDISQVSKISILSNLKGSITYEIVYSGGKILLNNRRYKQLDKFISKLSN